MMSKVMWLCCLVTAVLSLSVTALGASTPGTQEKAEHHKVRTITGCLQAGSEADEFNFTGNDGSTWELTSSAVKLAPHVGHTVTVTGTVVHAKLHGAKEETKEEMKEHGLKKEDAEHGHLRVTRLKMVSESCERR
jgi:hypothetical protein